MAAELAYVDPNIPPSRFARMYAALSATLGPARRIVHPLACYGSTRSLLSRRFAPLGIRCDAVDTCPTVVVTAGRGPADAPGRAIPSPATAPPSTPSPGTFSTGGER